MVVPRFLASEILPVSYYIVKISVVWCWQGTNIRHRIVTRLCFYTKSCENLSDRYWLRTVNKMVSNLRLTFIITEINPDVPCGWQLIYDRLKEQGRLELLDQVIPAKSWESGRDGGPRKLESKQLQEGQEEATDGGNE